MKYIVLKEVNEYPYSWMGWYIGICFSNSIFFTREIVGDWYLVLRTKSLIKNKSIPLVYITCIIYNISKLVAIIFYSMNLPEPYSILSDNSYTNQLREIAKNFTTIILIIQIASIIYDLANIYYLRKNFIDKYKKNQDKKKNGFIQNTFGKCSYRKIKCFIYRVNNEKITLLLNTIQLNMTILQKHHLILFYLFEIFHSKVIESKSLNDISLYEILLDEKDLLTKNMVDP
ncbi:hypothetical protein PIROE2DRAFT_17064 [Piromyces sp. E2]|nr:hypothetical protein PIROE2DRAFT_17064 [Piromyces sp. E2]|eukprot:OUM57833.1 hypothetical protein PIROE2DRAFT_17064 [Piromyces sp. E2]